MLLITLPWSSRIIKQIVITTKKGKIPPPFPPYKLGEALLLCHLRHKLNRSTTLPRNSCSCYEQQHPLPFKNDFSPWKQILVRFCSEKKDLLDNCAAKIMPCSEWVITCTFPIFQHNKNLIATSTGKSARNKKTTIKSTFSISPAAIYELLQEVFQK